MAVKKKAAAKPAVLKNSGPTHWEDDDVKYPRKRDICEMCGQRDDLKLAHDLRRYICVNAHACLLRLSKIHADMKK